ncbi:hypothetical protein TNCT_493901 [Trichonephila clavata]|uniref:Uncharacterized protein n=1 Tax=Trichonephila clavata TaxID=2740835 RepID=A0A8X6FUE0_TRICU|nr:hypothetical protein TNCT_493901 [Trichonephila clavata]
MEPMNVEKKPNETSRVMKFETDITYPQHLSPLKVKTAAREGSINPTLRERRQNPRYRTQPITFSEIQEIDEENYAMFQRMDLGKEQLSSLSGAHSERCIREPINPIAGAHPERSVQRASSPGAHSQEPLSPLNGDPFTSFYRNFDHMLILAKNRKSPRSDALVKSSSNEKINNETEMHIDDNNEEGETGKHKGVDQPEEDKKK